MDFEKAWREQQTAKEINDVQKFWDNRAAEFNEIGRNHGADDQLMQWLIEKKAVFEGAKVLDIGCGAGRYSKAFLKLGCQVTGIDISPCMIDFSRENTSDFKDSNFKFKVMSWEEISLAAEGWKDKFDLVFASMSPAINGPEALKKMIAASKGYCFISSHLYKKDQLGEELKQALGIAGTVGKYRPNLYYAFNILCEMRYYPELRNRENCRQKLWPVEKAVDYYKHMLNAKDDKTVESIRDYIEKKSSDGQVEDINDSKSGWLLWSVNN